MRQTIPDLKADHDEFTLDHCSILLIRLGETLDKIYGGGMSEIANQADPIRMRDDLLSVMSANQLCLLFNTDLGKGLITGVFYARFVVPQKVEE